MPRGTVIATNLHDGTSTTFSSCSNAAKVLGVHPFSVSQVLHKNIYKSGTLEENQNPFFVQVLHAVRQRMNENVGIR